MPVVAPPIAADMAARFKNNTAATASSPVGKFADGAHAVRVLASAFPQVNQMPQLSLRILQ